MTCRCGEEREGGHAHIEGEGREGADADMEVKERVRDMQICVGRRGDM